MVAHTNPAPAQQPAAQPAATLPAQRTETINYDNWIVTCREILDEPKKRNCSATVAVTRSETGQTGFELSVQPNDQGRLMALVQTPTGVSIAPSVEVKFDNAAVRKFPFDSCEQARCVASLPADTAFIRDISATGKIGIVVQSSDGKPANFEFPVKGFDRQSLRSHDEGLIGGPPLAALLAGDKGAMGISCIVAAMLLVDIGSFDRAAGECLSTADGFPQGVTCGISLMVSNTR